MDGKLSGLVKVRGVFASCTLMYTSCAFFFFEVARVYGWGWHWLGFRGPNIITCLIQMALGGFSVL